MMKKLIKKLFHFLCLTWISLSEADGSKIVSEKKQKYYTSTGIIPWMLTEKGTAGQFRYFYVYIIYNTWDIYIN